MSLYVLAAAVYGVMFVHRMSFAVFLILQGALTGPLLLQRTNHLLF